MNTCVYVRVISRALTIAFNSRMSEVQYFSDLTFNHVSFDLLFQSHRILLTICQAHQTYSDPGPCLCCSLSGIFLPQTSTGSDQLLLSWENNLTAFSKNGMSWNSLSLYLLYFSSWHLSLPGITLCIYLIVFFFLLSLSPN